MMKAVMYHYVRESEQDAPYFRFLDYSNFKKQLDFFENDLGIMLRNDFDKVLEQKSPLSGYILTFDDGFNDHYSYVYHELKKRNQWGIFYIPTSPLISNRLLDVHRIHFLLGRLGGVKCLNLLKHLLADEMLEKDSLEKFESLTYNLQDDDESTLNFKRILNYYVSYNYRNELIDSLMRTEISFSDEKAIARNFYLTPKQIREMSDNGMMIGSHSENHFLLSKLSESEQRKEISNSFNFLGEIIGKPIVSFCYPYGGWHSFTEETMKILKEVGSRFSFNVESKPISINDLKNKIQALPRFDCNEFDFGSATKGSMDNII